MISLRPACFPALGRRRRESLCNPGGRRSARGAAPAALVRAEAEINSATQQKADAASTTSLPEIFASRLVSCPARQSLRDSNVGTRSKGKASPHRPWNQGQE